MYLGVRTIEQRRWRQMHLTGIGDLTVPNGMGFVDRHFYRCEACGLETVGQLEQATEPFYCPCGGLIGIEKGGE